MIYEINLHDDVDPGMAHQFPLPLHPFEFLGGCFCKFWLHNTRKPKSQCNVYDMYFIFYFYYKNIGYVWRGIEQSPDPKNSTSPPLFDRKMS